MDAAKLEASRSPLAKPHVERAMRQQSALKLDSDHTFGVINAAKDDLGNTHVRMQQYYRGLKVVNGTLVSHADGKGSYLEYTDSLKREIHLSTQPKLNEAGVLEIVAKLKNHTGPYARPAKAELVIFPLMERVNKRTGETITPVERKPSPNAIPGELKAVDTEMRAKGYRLAYEVLTVEAGEGHDKARNAWLHHVDANTGEVLRSLPLSSSSSHTGTGNGKNSGQVNFATIDYNGGFRMEDEKRKFHVLDDDHSDDDPENKDANNNWGDGQVFAGDAKASAKNRQSAMVDAMFGSTVYWDLMSNVFHRQGPDDHFYSVNVFVHVGTEWDDDRFSYLSGNISIGDGAPGKANRQALDCLGHENGHGLQHFTASLDGCHYLFTACDPSGLCTPMAPQCDSGGLNESDSDIWGAMTAQYLLGGGFAAKSNMIPPAASDASVWQSRCSGRDLEKPSAAGHPQSDYWYFGVGGMDEHDAAAPNNRAFYFLAEGASPLMNAKNYSPLLPWGMKGIGAHKAAKIWFDALVHFFASDTDYPSAFADCLFAATLRFGPGSEEVKAVQNAYAGIGVSSTASDYPASPAMKKEGAERHNTFSTAEVVARPATKPAGVPASAPDKRSIFGSGNKSDFFRVSLKQGESINVRLMPIGLVNADLFLFSAGDSTHPIQSSTNGPAEFDLINLVAPGPGTQDFIIEVRPLSPGAYILDFDFF